MWLSLASLRSFLPYFGFNKFIRAQLVPDYLFAMRTRPSTSAFTLIEVVTAMAVVLILTGLVIQISGYVSRRGSQARASAEIALLSAGCESYKADTGGYPEDISGDSHVTEELKPKQHFTPTTKLYEKASLFLYKELTGDGDADGKPGESAQRYLKELDPKILKADRDKTTNQIKEVEYLRDPFGYSYGYSTAAASAEREFRQELATKGSSAKRTRTDEGFNSASFDLWSTGGSRPSSEPTDIKKKELEWAKWVKNW